MADGRWRVPGWALVPAVAAPVCLIGGMVIAASAQPAGYDGMRDTISALAARDAVDRGVMTAGFVGLGLAHLGTASALVGAGLAGRALLAVGGVSTLFVAVFALPGGGGGSSAHGVFALVAFLALAVWPLGLVSRRPDAPPPARVPVAVASTALLLCLVGWFGIEVMTDGTRIGRSERVAAVAESCWPLLVVCVARVWRRRQPRTGTGIAG